MESNMAKGWRHCHPGGIMLERTTKYGDFSRYLGSKRSHPLKTYNQVQFPAKVTKNWANACGAAAISIPKSPTSLLINIIDMSMGLSLEECFTRRSGGTTAQKTMWKWAELFPDSSRSIIREKGTLFQFQVQLYCHIQIKRGTSLPGMKLLDSLKFAP